MINLRRTLTIISLVILTTITLALACASTFIEEDAPPLNITPTPILQIVIRQG
jgi:hypothetical protein